MTSLSIFQFNCNQVRVISIDGEPWFVAKDIAEVLEYTDTSMMLKHVDNEDKTTINPQSMESVKMTDSISGNSFKVSIVNESGLYAVIFGSTKPEAKVFKKWVTSEVLPSIRKNGIFNTIPFKLSDDSKLVSFESDDYWVTSLTIAELFQKRHDNVLRDLDTAIEDLTNLLSSEEVKRFKSLDVTYIDDKNRVQISKKVNRALFNYVVLAYKGDVAKVYRSRFILAFEELERRVKVFLAQQMIYSNPKRQQVYVLRNTVTGMIKVGITNNIERRISELQNASECEISVEYLAPKSDNAKDIEREMHQLLVNYRGIGEWFNVPVSTVISLLLEQNLIINPTGLLLPSHVDD